MNRDHYKNSSERIFEKAKLIRSSLKLLKCSVNTPLCKASHSTGSQGYHVNFDVTQVAACRHLEVMRVNFVPIEVSAKAISQACEKGGGGEKEKEKEERQ